MHAMIHPKAQSIPTEEVVLLCRAGSTSALMVVIGMKAALCISSGSIQTASKSVQ